MVERSLSMREVPGSIPGASIIFCILTWNCIHTLLPPMVQPKESLVCLMHSLSKTFTIKSRSWWGFFTYISRQRPYHVEYTSSRSITEVKQRRARLVLGWETAWEHRVLLAFYFLVLQLECFQTKFWLRTKLTPLSTSGLNGLKVQK